MNKCIKRVLGELEENDLVFINGGKYYVIDTKDDGVLLQSTNGEDKLILNKSDDVLQIVDAPRGFEHVDTNKIEYATCGYMPERKTAKSAGYDFFSPIDLIIAPNESKIIWTNIKVFMEEDEFFQVSVRSSIGKKGLILLNGVGIIDSDYYSNPENDGNIGFLVRNVSDDGIIIKKQDRIGQGVFFKYLTTFDDKATGVRQGGLGSTGR